MRQRLIKRRKFLLSLGALGGIGACTTSNFRNWHNLQQAFANGQNDLIAQAIPALDQQAAAKGLIYGSAGSYANLTSDSAYTNLFTQQCEILTPENELKWRRLRPTPKRFDFRQGDWLANFARSHNMQFRGHTLVWHESLPDWFEDIVNAQNAEQFLTQHINTVVKHYAGQVHSWDVINEAIDVKSGEPGGLRNTPWLKFLGRDYFDIAFRSAAQADPQALLVYNDFGLDADTPQADAKRNAVLQLLRRLKSNGTPIQALGTQAHLFANPGGTKFTKVRRFLGDVADLGLKILVTELDVADKNLPKDPATRDRIVADVYRNYLSAVLAEPAVIVVQTWGLSDRYTWLTKQQPRSDGAAVRPLPFDAQLQPKPAKQAMTTAFSQAPARSAQITQPTPTTFSDIQGHWAQPFIQALLDKNILAGFPDGTFRPNSPVTRAEFSAIVNRAFREVPQNNPTIEFQDVPRSFWGYNAIQIAVRRGFVVGYPGRIFKPQQQIPRVQVIVALASGLNLSTSDLNVLSVYQDANQIPTYARRQVAAATQREIVVNYPSVRLLNPNRNATRAEVAAFIYQALVNAGDAESISSPYIVQISR